jgi:hypothetical protein
MFRTADRLHLAGLFEKGLTNLVAHNHSRPGRQDLRVTLEKLLTGELFGAERYLEDGFEQEQFTLQGSSDKTEVVTRGHDFVSRCPGLNPRVAGNYHLAVDELVTNGLYNAPVDSSGAPRFRGLRRDFDIRLEQEERVMVRFFFDGRRLAVSVCDSFGSLAPQQVRSYLSRCFEHQEPTADVASGGAGLGLFYVFDSMNHLVINLSPGRKTEVIGIVDAVRSYKDFARRPKSFNIFTERASAVPPARG